MTKGDTRKNKGGKKWTKEAHALKKKFKKRKKKLGKEKK